MSESISFSEPLAKARELLSENASTNDWVVGFGGCTRMDKTIAGWSDLDLIFCPSHMSFGAQALARSISAAIRYEFDMDCTMIVVANETVDQRFQRVNPFNSALLNALSGRPNTSLTVIGQPPLATSELSHEISNAMSYIGFVESQISRLFVESASLADKTKLKRMIKWISSFFLCYVRSEGVFVGPYDSPLIKLVSRLSPQKIEFWQSVFKLRFSWSTLTERDCEPLFSSIYANFCATLEVLNARKVMEP
jgi:hypothetical protein